MILFSITKQAIGLVIENFRFVKRCGVFHLVSGRGYEYLLPITERLNAPVIMVDCKLLMVTHCAFYTHLDALPLKNGGAICWREKKMNNGG
ncbi:hypothetical protein GOB83_13740 [Acetobacter fabarum]|uniref:hypothetical protein n=1 Tax=Acetobacter fabarum TaxID=483199 RepID=UPI001404D091|nr:hypothetical protein [Acetobacter fabarum]NHO43216.1 hypothetical protein [Acetobacter fabarum]